MMVAMIMVMMMSHNYLSSIAIDMSDDLIQNGNNMLIVIGVIECIPIPTECNKPQVSQQA